MRTEIEALKEIRDRISYFCSRTDGKYDPPWAQEVIGIIDDVLITPYRQCKRFGAPFYVEVGTSIVAIRCASNHDVVWRADHSVFGKYTIDWAESVCTRMNQEAHKRERGDAAKLREALIKVKEWMEHRIATCGFEASATFPTMLEDVVLPALAAPPRNCDVGTIVEQYKRFKKFCFDNMGDGMDEDRCCKCPLCKTGSSCRFAWSQMPYEEGVKYGQ